MVQQEDFLQQYQAAWQQDSQRLGQAIDLSPEMLHGNIERLRRQRRQRALWLGGVAACLLLAAGLWWRLAANSQAPQAEPLLAQQDAMQILPNEQETIDTDLQSLTAAVKESQKPTVAALRRPATLQPQLSSAVATPLLTQEPAAASAEPMQAADAVVATPVATAVPVTCVAPRQVETSQLVAFVASTPDGLAYPESPLAVVECDNLVQIIPPRRNTFREAVVEPILALVTKDIIE